MQPITTEASPEVQAFLETHPGLAQLLAEAEAHLQETFGDHRLRLMLVPEPEMGEITLYCGIVTSLDPDEADERFLEFGEKWWIEQYLQLRPGMIFCPEANAV